MKLLRNFIFFIIFIFSCNLSFAQTAGEELTLLDCYKLSLKQSEVIAMDAQAIIEAEAHFLQALSIVLPHLSFNSEDDRQDATNFSSISPQDGYERKFTYKQTLFSGFKAIAGITGSELEKKQRQNEKLRAEQLLFLDVSDAFYLILQQEEDLQTLGIIKTALVKRIQELKEREDLGRSRHSETVNTQVQLYRIEAQFETVKSGLEVARNLLEFLVGKSVVKIKAVDKGFPNLNPEDEYVALIQERPDVFALKNAWEVSKKAVLIAKSGFLPTVSLEGNYYTARNTVPTDSNWDATLKVAVPIFEATEVFGNVKEAKAKEIKAGLEYFRLKRKAAQEIRDAYERLSKNISKTKALNKALAASYNNYHLQKEDYRLSLVNNLDVLDAIRTMGESRRDYIQAMYETKRLYWQLLVQTGQDPTAKLK